MIEKNTDKRMKVVDEKEIVFEVEKFKAMLLLQRSDDARYGNLPRKLLIFFIWHLLYNFLFYCYFIVQHYVYVLRL